MLHFFENDSKMNYLKLQIQTMVAAMDQKKSIVALNLLKEINVLQCIYWIKKAWDDIKEQTVQKCFKECGFVEQIVEDGE